MISSTVPSFSPPRLYTVVPCTSPAAIIRPLVSDGSCIILLVVLVAMCSPICGWHEFNGAPLVRLPVLRLSGQTCFCRGSAPRIPSVLSGDAHDDTLMVNAGYHFSPPEPLLG